MERERGVVGEKSCNNDNNMDIDIDQKKLPPIITSPNNDNDTANAKSSGAAHTNNNGFVPLQFVHVPNNNKTTSANGSTNTTTSLDVLPKRAPSVPSLPALLSNEILRNKNNSRESRKEQFEERLRRAHLRLLKSDNNNASSLSDDDVGVCVTTRYRSRSTPPLRHIPHIETSEADVIMLHSNHDLSQIEATTKQQPLPPSDDILQPSIRPTELVVNNATTNFVMTNNIIDTPRRGVNSSSVQSSAGSALLSGVGSLEEEVGHHHHRNILQPPPPPPPATEKERLVERERQARLEAERARRRQLALQRERQLEEEGEGRRGECDNNAVNMMLGDVSFDDGDALDHHRAIITTELVNIDQEEVSSSSSIPRRPPLPPPPTTERERLVERERQARLETERARLRHLALQRAERNNNESSSNDDIIDMDDTNMAVMMTSVLPQTAGGDDDDTNNSSNPSSAAKSRDRSDVQNTEAENLSYPMERFLERVDDDNDEQSGIILPIDNTIDASSTPAVVENDTTTALPYTMELFLADNAVVSENENDVVESAIVGSDTIDTNDTHRESNHIVTEPIIDNLPYQRRSLGVEMNDVQNESLVVSSPPSDRSVASNIASTTGGSLDNVDQANNNHLASLLPPSNDSFDAIPHNPHLTEEDIAHLAEVEHASIGNAPPQSIRDEPSEASVVGAPLDHAFSVATPPTVIESMTEASEVNRLMGSHNERESLDVIRVGVSGSGLSTQTGSDGGASSASVEAMPSRASVSTSDRGGASNEIDQISSNSMSYSIPGPLGSHDEIGMPRLTEAGISTMADIDHASIGNAPPHSVRDSELSVSERGGRQFSTTTPINEIGSVDDHNHPENSSVEVMPSDDTDEEDIVGSSASIEAMPSVDLSDVASSSRYGAIPSGHESQQSVDDLRCNLSVIDDDSDDQDIEAGALLQNESTPFLPADDRLEGMMAWNNPSGPRLNSSFFGLTPTVGFAIGLGFGLGVGVGLGLGLK